MALNKFVGRMKTIIIGMDKCSVKKLFSDVYRHAQVLSKKNLSQMYLTQLASTATNKSYIVTKVREVGTQEQTKEGKMGPF